ncbi:hypothetical protein T06_14516 [Trichinella sp. T6]|nr:hypothetical protein T06_14516 [Trichinella sp. T6]
MMHTTCCRLDVYEQREDVVGLVNVTCCRLDVYEQREDVVGLLITFEHTISVRTFKHHKQCNQQFFKE